MFTYRIATFYVNKNKALNTHHGLAGKPKKWEAVSEISLLRTISQSSRRITDIFKEEKWVERAKGFEKYLPEAKRG